MVFDVDTNYTIYSFCVITVMFVQKRYFKFIGYK